MKLDRAFYDAVSKEVKEQERIYVKKYRNKFILGVFIFWLIFSVIWGIISKGGGIPEAIVEIIFFFVFVLPILGYFVDKMKYASVGETKILEKIVADNGGAYVQYIDLKMEKASMFSKGHSRSAYGGVYFTGESGERVRLFQYRFFTGSGNNQKMFDYRVFSISGLKVVPHIYLNYRHNKYAMSLGQELSMPALFEKEFSVSIPKGYHLEALQLFTPDVLEVILNLPLKCDIEFVDGEVIFFLEGIRNLSKDFEKLEKYIEGAKKIVSLLKPKLEDIRWAPVGDLSYHM
jgi:hypothetical protein